MKNAMKVSKVKSVTIRMGHWHLVMPLLLTLMFGLGQPASVKAEHLDAIFANSGDTNRICLGDGLGGFTCSDVSANINTSQSVAVGFVNGDSFLDAVFANGAGGDGERNRVCLGDGLGGFACSDVSDDVELSWGVALGFVDGDSFLDAVFANRFPGQPNQVCFGDGTGGFTSPCTNITALESVAVDLGFMNDDNFLDAVFGNFNNTVSLCLGNGTGGFTSCTDYSFGPSQNSVTDVALGFFSGMFSGTNDSFLDVVVATISGCTNVPGCSNGVCRGDGEGGLSCGGIDAKPDGPDSLGVALGFVDGDSLPDAVFANAGDNNTICDSTDSSSLPCPRVVSADTFKFSSHSVALGLVNGDSFLDAVFANRGQTNRVCLGDGT